MGASIANTRAVKEPQLFPQRRVLLVDNDERDLKYHADILMQRGYEVRPFPSYTEGERCLRDEAFDFVVVSQGGPALPARSLLELAVMKDRRLPVLVVTRSVDIKCYLEVMQLGAVDYLEKPLTPGELLRVLETHLPSRQLARGHTA
jgi:DNA-binding NtrC family response regulator